MLKYREWRRVWREENRSHLRAYDKNWRIRHSARVTSKLRKASDQRVIQNEARLKIKVSNCSLCPETRNINRHHFDYNRPLDIIPLCRTHHRRLHVLVAKKELSMYDSVEKIKNLLAQNNDP